jgi:hypothetical protein
MSQAYNREVYSGGKVSLGCTNEPSLANVTPHNCKTPCVYGKATPFCFPCMAKILADGRRKTA